MVLNISWYHKHHKYSIEFWGIWYSLISSQFLIDLNKSLPNFVFSRAPVRQLHPICLLFHGEGRRWKLFDDLNPNKKVSRIWNWGFGLLRTNSVLYEDEGKSKCFSLLNFENLIELEKAQQFKNLMDAWVLYFRSCRPFF